MLFFFLEVKPSSIFILLCANRDVSYWNYRKKIFLSLIFWLDLEPTARGCCSALQDGSPTEVSFSLLIWLLLMAMDLPVLVITVQKQGKCLLAFFLSKASIRV